ncbi:MAG: hypothetical protein V3S45_05790 [Kiloniellales bacterium]
MTAGLPAAGPRRSLSCMDIPPLAALAVTVALAACAAEPTPYQPRTDGTGYAEQQLDAQTWRVLFTGNAGTSRETVEDYLLYRSAEIMRAGGYETFVMLEKDVERTVDIYDIGYGPYDNGRFWPHRGPHDPYDAPTWWHRYGPRRYASLTSYTAYATIRALPSSAVEVPPPGGAPVYDARELIRHLGPTIKPPQSGDR